MTIFSILIITM